MTSKLQSKILSRRQALSLLGLAGAAAYAMPTVLTVSEAKAEEEVRIRTRRVRTHRRSPRVELRERRRSPRVELRERSRRFRTRRRTDRGFGLGVEIGK